MVLLVNTKGVTSCWSNKVLTFYYERAPSFTLINISGQKISAGLSCPVHEKRYRFFKDNINIIAEKSSFKVSLTLYQKFISSLAKSTSLVNSPPPNNITVL